MDALRFLRLPAVKELTGLKKSTIYEKIKAKEFPAPVPLGKAPNGPVGWIDSEVADWQQQRIKLRATDRVA